MAPKKNIDKPQKVVKKPAPKEKLAKPKLNTPKIIKVPPKGSGAPPKIQKIQQKIELANEVALAQLVKTPKVENGPDDSKLMPSPASNKTPTKKTTPHTEINVKQNNQMATPVRKRKLIRNVTSADEPGLDNTPLSAATTGATVPKRTRKCATKLTSPRVALTKVAIDISSENPTISLNQIPAAETQKPIQKAKPRTRARTATPVQNKNVAMTSTNGHDSTVEVLKDTVSETLGPTVKRPVRKRNQKIVSVFFPEVPTFDSTSESSVSDTAKPAKKVGQRKKSTPRKCPPIEDVPEDTNKASVPRTAKRPRGRPKFASERGNVNTTIENKRKDTTNKVLNAKELKAAASKLEDALQNIGQAEIETNSVKSNNSNLSWTKDISNSSTTTCVTVSSNDFICFNNKLPIVQLNDLNVKPEIEEQSSSSSSSSESSDSSEDNYTDVASRQDLNLSTSSLSLQCDHSGQENTERLDNIKLLCFEIDKLTHSMNNFYAEMEKWIVFDDDETCTFFNVLEALHLEKNLVADCESFKSIVEKVNHSKVSKSAQESAEKVEFLKPSFRRPSVARRGSQAPNVSNQTSNSTVVENGTEKVSGNSENLSSDSYNDVPFDKTYDDDDALSLFAESITGIESSRFNSSIASSSNVRHDAYVPKPKTVLPEKYSYMPTKIDSEPVKAKTVCEKQNADSTSIRDSDINRKAMELIKDASRLSSLAPPSVQSPNKDPPTSPTKPRLFLLDSHYQKTNPVKSNVYRGVCFFYLSGACKNIVCRFPHVEPDLQFFEKRIHALSEDQFIEEYLLTRSLSTLRRKYGALFVQECMRRDYTRILMEMANDFCLNCVSREDYSLRVSSLECALMHLNTVSLDACDDLLKLESKSNGIMLCDTLLRSIAESQNFARFKPVFIKLSRFMSEIGRSVDIDVVGKILERVSILPCEEALARAMLGLIKNTDRAIFQNRMTEPFEMQLSTLESDVYEEYLLEKKAAIEAMLEQPYVQDTQPVDMVAERKRYTSPDTTNLDGLKKGTHTPTITRTVDFTQSTIHTAVRVPFKQPAAAPWRHFTPRNYTHTNPTTSWRQRPMRARGMHPTRRVVYRPAYGGGADM